MDEYYKKMVIELSKILDVPTSDILTYDILDTPKCIQYKMIALKEKQRQMKVGQIWQIMLGNYKGFEDLRIGHESGLDIVSHERKIIIELKNRTNTDNSSSKKANFDKLALYKSTHQDYTVIYGNINDNTEKKTNKCKIYTKIHNNQEIKIYIGKELLQLILGDDTEDIIQFIKDIIDLH